MRPSVIVLEFNELSPRLMDDFIEQGRLPNFARLRRESYVSMTDAEEQSPNLEPWIQWVTVHTGLSFKEHGVFDLDGGHKLNAPRLWDLLSNAGYRVWVCGSMNAWAEKGINGFILPDPWSTKLRPYPEGEFDVYYDFVRRYVQEYTRDTVPLSKMDHVRFVQFMVARGLSPQTITQTVQQLMNERGGKNRWRRAAILDRLQWDVFRRYWSKYRPDYATFFLNSTAHFQHIYWRNMEPGPFQLKPSPAEQAEYGNAVLFGYQQMDKLVGECLTLAGADTTVILCTALSQQPCLIYEESGGKSFYRVEEPQQLLSFAGISHDFKYAPVMSEQFRLYFQTEQDAAEACDKLKALRVDEREALMVRHEGKEVFAGCCIFKQLSGDSMLRSTQTGQAARFLDHFYMVEGTKSGMHHPEGIFWVRTPAKHHRVREDKIPLRKVAPTILSLFDLPKPEFMSEALTEITAKS
ncbi:MAG: alkaline phosphatase family protein [Pyrinomonadaceae bacterium]